MPTFNTYRQFQTAVKSEISGFMYHDSIMIATRELSNKLLAKNLGSISSYTTVTIYTIESEKEWKTGRLTILKQLLLDGADIYFVNNLDYDAIIFDNKSIITGDLEYIFTDKRKNIGHYNYATTKVDLAINSIQLFKMLGISESRSFDYYKKHIRENSFESTDNSIGTTEPFLKDTRIPLFSNYPKHFNGDISTNNRQRQPRNAPIKKSPEKHNKSGNFFLGLFMIIAGIIGFFQSWDKIPSLAFILTIFIFVPMIYFGIKSLSGSDNEI